ncbi:inovirus-type Gp2 protein [Chitinibacter tainanensis]|uniref:YagK/YfjJ domain-containing protein n=1 Tax=Chitinibacter tainanensis TaxID=230667 RepID=UPI00235384B1|nr:inovirus-type Gp2 protein [Chitinibacter tainanensis]
MLQNQEPIFHITASEFLDEVSKNFINANQFVTDLFTERSRLLVIRLDLGLRGDSARKYDPYHLRECFNHLLNNRRQKPSLFANCLGYIWSLELGQEKGFHYHCYFFYDGAYSQQDQNIGHGIGQYWQQVTHSEGTYYCSNDDKAWFEQQGTCGIGMISRHEVLKRNNLTNLVGYLFKDEANTRACITSLGLKNIRLYGKGR